MGKMDVPRFPTETRRPTRFGVSIETTGVWPNETVHVYMYTYVTTVGTVLPKFRDDKLVMSTLVIK